LIQQQQNSLGNDEEEQKNEARKDSLCSPAISVKRFKTPQKICPPLSQKQKSNANNHENGTCDDPGTSPALVT